MSDIWNILENGHFSSLQRNDIIAVILNLVMLVQIVGRGLATIWCAGLSSVRLMSAQKLVTTAISG